MPNSNLAVLREELITLQPNTPLDGAPLDGRTLQQCVAIYEEVAADVKWPQVPNDTAAAKAEKYHIKCSAIRDLVEKVDDGA